MNAFVNQAIKVNIAKKKSVLMIAVDMDIVMIINVSVFQVGLVRIVH